MIFSHRKTLSLVVTLIVSLTCFPTHGAAQDPMTVISAVGTVVGTFRSVMGLFSKPDNHDAEIAQELQKITAQDQEIITKLGVISQALDKVDADVLKIGIQNQQNWTIWFSTTLGVPIDALSTRMATFSGLKQPTKSQRIQYLKDVKDIYQSFSEPMVHGIGYGNPVAMQLVVAILAEERAGEIIDPPSPRKSDGPLVELRLEILNHRIDTLNNMLDVSSNVSMGYLVKSNKDIVDSLGPKIDFINKYYVGTAFPWGADSTTDVESPDKGATVCDCKHTTPHVAVISYDKDTGYSVKRSDKAPIVTTSNCRAAGGVLRQGDHMGGMRGQVAQFTITLPGVPPQPSDPFDQDWNANVAKFQAAWQQYHQSSLIVQQFTPVRDSLASTVDLLNSKRDVVYKTCVALGTLVCDGPTPHVKL